MIQEQVNDKAVAISIKGAKLTGRMLANEFVKCKYAGLPLTNEEYAIYRAWQDKKTEQV